MLVAVVTFPQIKRTLVVGQRQGSVAFQARSIEFPSTSAAQAEEFLDGNFSVITDMRNLPSPVLAAFTERGGSRLGIANPGQKFRATDVVVDVTMPSKRLILSGVSGEKVFVHYEQGGIGLSNVLALFAVPLKERLQPVWGGYCRAPAGNVQELQAWVRDGTCISANRPPAANWRYIGVLVN